MIVSEAEIQNLISQLDIEPENIQSEGRRQRYEILLRKLRILFNSNGFTKELMEQMDTKYFVEKGFTIPESILLTKPSRQIHPTIEEIQKLVLDNQTNILKLEYSNDSMPDNKYYIIVMGPTNRGKTTFIFNIINKFFNVSRDSLYRIKKREIQESQQNYYDEYIVKIDEKKTYVFADFRGLGDFKLDFLGLDTQQKTAKTTLYTELLNYLTKHYNEILAVLFCNSSSINRLGQDEKYQLQRFFEVLPKDFIHKVLLILTYCTDNQPLMSVYQNFEGMPEQLRVILGKEYVQREEKFWFGINNANLYNMIDYDKEQEQRQEIQRQQQQIQQQIQQIEQPEEQEDEKFQKDRLSGQMPKKLVDLLNQYSNNRHQQLFKIVDVEQGNIDDNQQGQDQGGQEIDLPEYEWPKLYYNQMLTTLDEFLEKLKTLENQLQNNKPTFNQRNFFISQKEFEVSIINLQFEFKRLARLKQQIFPLGQLSVTTYIKNQFLNNEQQTATKVAKKLTKFMFCRTCSKFCHEVCHLIDLNEIYNNQKMCRKLDFKKFQDAINVDREQFAQLNNEDKKEFANRLIKCKKCIKNNPEGRNCKIDDHQISAQIQQSEQKMIPYFLSRLNEAQPNRNIQNSSILRQQSQILQTQQIRNPTYYENFITEYSQYRQSKQLIRLFQQKVISLEIEQRDQIHQIRDGAFNQQNQGLTSVNLNQRFEFLNAMQVQLQNNSLNDDFNLKLEEVLKVYSQFKPEQSNSKQNQLNIPGPNEMEHSFGQLPNGGPPRSNPPQIALQQNQNNFQQGNDQEQASPVRGLRNSSFLNASENQNLLTHGQQ